MILSWLGAWGGGVGLMGGGGAGGGGGVSAVCHLGLCYTCFTVTGFTVTQACWTGFVVRQGFPGGPSVIGSADLKM